MDVTIRRIEEKDKGAYLKLYDNEDFGCFGILSELKPSVYVEENIVNKIISKEIIDTEILVVESNGEFIGYACISRVNEDLFHIGHIAIVPSERKKGYGTLLINRIKEYASFDNCDIKLECISSAQTFFKKCGFVNTRGTDFNLKKQNNSSNTGSLFVDYDLIRSQREELENKELKSFEKFLKSPLFKEFNNML